MSKLSRRSVLQASVCLAAGGTLARPYIANAAAKTATVWWTQGFIPEEDAGFEKMVADYEKVSGNKIDYSILPFLALEQKMVSALQTNHTPDLIAYDGIQTTLVMSAWNNKLVDVSDVVATQEKHFGKTALLSTNLYNSIEKRRAYYAVPFKSASAPFHVWGNLVEKAGFKMADCPNTWIDRWNWFKPMQAKLRGDGMRQIYSLGLQMTTNGPSDGNNLFNYWMLALGGGGIVTPDGQVHIDDPKVKNAVVQTITWMTDAYKGGYTPSGCISWNDADDNNGFHSKLFVADLDGTLSTELAMFHRPEDFDNCVTLGLPMGSDGKQSPASVGVIGGMIPKAAANIDVAKDFMKYVIQPKVDSDFLKAGLGRWAPVFPEQVKDDPFWLNNENPQLAKKLTPYIHETILGPSLPDYLVFNPGWADVEAQQVWGQAYADVYKNGLTPEKAADNAFKRVEQLLARYPMTA